MNPIKTIFVQLFALALVFNRQVAAARDRNEIDKIKILEKIEENSANSTGRMLVSIYQKRMANRQTLSRYSRRPSAG